MQRIAVASIRLRSAAVHRSTVQHCSSYYDCFRYCTVRPRPSSSNYSAGDVSAIVDYADDLVSLPFLMVIDMDCSMATV